MTLGWPLHHVCGVLCQANTLSTELSYRSGPTKQGFWSPEGPTVQMLCETAWAKQEWEWLLPQGGMWGSPRPRRSQLAFPLSHVYLMLPSGASYPPQRKPPPQGQVPPAFQESGLVSEKAHERACTPGHALLPGRPLGTESPP